MVNSAFHRRTKGPGETRRARAASASDLGPRTSDLGHGFLRDASESAATAPGVWLRPWEREQRGAPDSPEERMGVTRRPARGRTDSCVAEGEDLPQVPPAGAHASHPRRSGTRLGEMRERVG